MLLQVNHLSTHFHSHHSVIKAVDDVSFDLDEGETLGIVGESGCGKTVSALSLLRLIPDPPGRIAGARSSLKAGISCSWMKKKSAISGATGSP